MRIGKVTARGAVLMTALAFSAVAFGMDPGTREKIAALGARSAGSNTNFASVACHAPPGDVAGYTDRARKKFAADSAFDTHFAAGQADGAELARKVLALAAVDSLAKDNLAANCRDALEHMKTR